MWTVVLQQIVSFEEYSLLNYFILYAGEFMPVRSLVLFIVSSLRLVLDFTTGICTRLAAESMYIIAPFEFKLFGRTIEILTEISIQCGSSRFRTTVNAISRAVSSFWVDAD